LPAIIGEAAKTLEKRRKQRGNSEEICGFRGADLNWKTDAGSIAYRAHYWQNVFALAQPFCMSGGQ